MADERAIVRDETTIYCFHDIIPRNSEMVNKEPILRHQDYELHYTPFHHPD